MIKFIKNLRLLNLFEQSAKTLSIFEKVAKDLDRINEKLFKEKTKRQLEIDILVQECQSIHETITRNKNIEAKVNKFLND